MQTFSTNVGKFPIKVKYLKCKTSNKAAIRIIASERVYAIHSYKIQI